MSVSSPDELLFGGIRNARIELRNLQSELTRNTDQTSENLQTANAFSGATVTNTLTQSLIEETTGALDVDQIITIPPPSLPAAGVPDKFLDNFNFLQRVATQAEIFDILGRGRADASQTQRIGQTAFADGASATGIMSTAQNTITQSSINFQTIDQTNLNFNFTAQTGTLPVVVARDREITVTADRSTTEGVSNLIQIQGVAPETSGSAGAKEVLKSSAPLQTTTSAANLATDLNDLQGGTGTYQDGVDTIVISGTNKGGSAISPLTFTYGNTSAGVAEVISTTNIQTNGGNVALTTALNDLDINQTDYAAGDEIGITGTDFDNAVVQATFTFGAGASEVVQTAQFLDTGGVPVVNTTTINSLGDAFINGPFIEDDGNGVGDRIMIELTDNDGASTSETLTFDFGTGAAQDGTTVGDLLNVINTGSSDAVASISGGRIVFTAQTAGARNLALNLRNPDGSATEPTNPGGTLDAAIASTVLTEGAGAGNGTTLGDLIDFINGANSGTDVFPQSALALNGNQLELTAGSTGTAALALTLADVGTTKTNWPAFTEETAGSGAVTGDGTTLGDLIAKISSAFSDATASLDSAGNILLTADTLGVAQFALSLRDDAGSANRGFVNNAFTENVAGADAIAGSILPGASFQTARANFGMAFNTLNEIASSNQRNVVINTHTVDVRRGADVGGTFEQAALTPRSMDIIIRMNATEGDISRTSNIGSAVQAQALVQTAEGGVDQNGNPLDGGGNVMNTALQQATGVDDTSVTSFTQINA
jgi:hypothetical protein